MFAINDYLKVIRYLNLRIDSASLVKDALTTAEASLEVETEVKDVLAKLDQLNDSLYTERSSANSGLIKADVLEWASPEARSGGMVASINQLRVQLANLLGLEHGELPYSGRTTTVEISVNS